jgi:RNA polymerase sigma-70 factor, ECF subfamily
VSEADADLLARAAAGEPVAVRQLLDGPAAVLYGFVFARVGGDRATAEDIVQETLLEAVRGAAGFRGDSALSTWLCTIGRRRLARHYERERKQDVARSGLTAIEGGGAEPEAADPLVEDRDAVIRALGRLPALHRQVLVLKYLDDLSVAEVAEALGRTRVQVQSLLQRARDGLRVQLAEEAG